MTDDQDRSLLINRWFAVIVATVACSMPSVAQVPAQSATAPRPLLTAPGLEPLPHQHESAAKPYPDYFTEALKLTRSTPGARFQALKLAPGVAPDLLVLPVQMQAFGFSPAFTALVGAMLDRELSSRGLRGNRQTDLFDADGPYVRRFDARAIEGFASTHPKAPLLALYVGRDGAGRNLLTLAIKRDSRTVAAHRNVDESDDAAAALRSLEGPLASMLDELGLAASAASRRVPGAAGCRAEDWALADLAPDGPPRERACRALVMGVLLPLFEWPTGDHPELMTPDKLAWLAAAYAGADALAPALAAAVRTLAWTELELNDPRTPDTLALAVDVDDPVVRPLARLLWARARTAAMPVRSANEEVLAYTAAAATHLPPMARALFTQRARLRGDFGGVDLCAIEQQVLTFRRSAQCPAGAPEPGRAVRPATRAQSAQLEAWRLAHAHRGLMYQSLGRRSPAARQAVLDALPAGVAAHPFVRQARFATENFDAASGPYEELLRRAEAAARDFLQATADTQRVGKVQSQNGLAAGRWVRNERLRAEPSIAALARGEWRLLGLLGWDAFARSTDPLARYAGGPAADYLRADAGPHSSAAAAPPAAAPPRQTPPGTSPEEAERMRNMPRLFNLAAPGSIGLPTEAGETTVSFMPMEMEPRVTLALARMKAGQDVAQARRFVDERPTEGRSGGAINVNESHQWATAAHAFFFAGEIEAAKGYYERALRAGSGSESEWSARVRLPLIAGDLKGALSATHNRLARYESDFARRDLAGLELIVGRPEVAWTALHPRLPQSAQLELWMAAQAGHRIEGRTARQVHDWMRRNSYARAAVKGQDLGAMVVTRHMIDDRRPTDDDLVLASQTVGTSDGAALVMEVMARLMRLVADENFDARALDSVRDLLDRAQPTSVDVAKPLYTWVAWHASRGRDPEFLVLREAGLADDFNGILAKSILLGLEGKTDESVAYLRGARIELAALSWGGLRDEARSAPYTVALVASLLHRKTKHAAFRDEALRLARAYRTISPYLAWPYALEALYLPDGPPRLAAACRARYLDRESLFLKMSGMAAQADGAACQKPLW
ncbi:MAG: hypothetical protein JNN03_12260 [Rubrivivax sp.]|nr:hypothetical protein [Rubrivivax sp.]